MFRTLPQFLVGLTTGGCAGVALVFGDVFPMPAPLLAPLPAAFISVGLVLFGLLAALHLPRRRLDNSESSNTPPPQASLGVHAPGTEAGSGTPAESSGPSLADASPTIIESSPGPGPDASCGLDESSSSPELDDSPPLDEVNPTAEETLGNYPPVLSEAKSTTEETPDDYPPEDAAKPAPAEHSADLSHVADTRETPPEGLDTVAETSRGLHEEDTRDADERSYIVMQALSAQKHDDSNNEDTSS